MVLVAPINYIQQLGLRNSVAKTESSSFDDLLHKFDKYVTVEDSELLLKNMYQSKVLKDEKQDKSKKRSGAHLEVRPTRRWEIDDLALKRSSLWICLTLRSSPKFNEKDYSASQL